MQMYTLNPISVSYLEGREYTENDIIFWAESVADRLNQEWTDPTLLLDRETYDYIDIYRAIEILEKVNEYVEPVML